MTYQERASGFLVDLKMISEKWKVDMVPNIRLVDVDKKEEPVPLDVKEPKE